ncbi:hypothetical protein ACSQ67_006034 [Phaseolus vulgaris]
MSNGGGANPFRYTLEKIHNPSPKRSWKNKYSLNTWCPKITPFSGSRDPESHLKPFRAQNAYPGWLGHCMMQNICQNIHRHYTSMVKQNP